MSLERIREYIESRTLRNRILFTGTRRRMTSVTVRGDQMARELGGYCLRSKYLTDAAVKSSPAVVWVVEHSPELLKRFSASSPQILDVINPPGPDWYLQIPDRFQSFRYLMLNTASSLEYLGQEPEKGWKWWVVPHHHCNFSGYQLAEARVERPLTIGYVGQPEHLHDSESIEACVSKLGLKWLSADTRDLDGYKNIDIGVAWTRRDKLRDETRSNIKLANFAAHGIPSVVCAYESYRDVDARLGGGATIVCSTLGELLEGLAEIVENPDQRVAIAKKARPALEMYSIQAIGGQYRQIISEARADFDRQSPR